MTNPIADPGHGHSPAAWTGVIIMLAGFTIGTLAFCLAAVSRFFPAITEATAEFMVNEPLSS